MKIGIQELLVVFIVALIVIGPDKLPMYAKKLGIALAQFRKFSEDATKDIRESIVEPLEEAQRPLREAIEPITELEKSVKSNVNEIQKSFADIGKPKKTSDPDSAEKSAEQSEKKEDGTSAQPEAIGKAEGQETAAKEQAVASEALQEPAAVSEALQETAAASEALQEPAAADSGVQDEAREAAS